MANTSQHLETCFVAFQGFPGGGINMFRSLMNRCVNWDLMVYGKIGTGSPPYFMVKKIHGFRLRLARNRMIRIRDV